MQRKFLTLNLRKMENSFIVRNGRGVVIKYPRNDFKVLSYNERIMDWECVESYHQPVKSYNLTACNWADIKVGDVCFYSDLMVEQMTIENMAEYCIKLSDRDYVFMLDDGTITNSDVLQDYCYKITE